MNPTTELRLLRKTIKSLSPEGVSIKVKVHVLQQKWVKDPFSRFKSAVKSEWRDVPIVEEE